MTPILNSHLPGFIPVPGNLHLSMAPVDHQGRLAHPARKNRYPEIRVKQMCRLTPYVGDGHLTFNRNLYNGYINPYYWVDDHPLLYGNHGSLDPTTNHVAKKTGRFLFSEDSDNSFLVGFFLVATKLRDQEFFLKMAFFSKISKISQRRSPKGAKMWLALELILYPTWCQNSPKFGRRIKFLNVFHPLLYTPENEWRKESQVPWRFCFDFPFKRG